MPGRNGKFAKKVLCILLTLVLAFSGMNVPGTGLMTAEVIEAEAAAAKLSKTKKTLTVGKSFTLKVKNASKKYTFESSDPSVAKVKTKSGKKTKIVAVSAGKATITATLGSKVLKCVVTVKGKKAAVTPTPVPTPIPTCTVSTDGSSVFELAVGGKLQLKLSGKEVRRYYTSDSDKQYLDVTEDGLVTAKKAASNPVTIKIEDKSYYYYQCKIKIYDAGGAVPTPTPAPTAEPTKTPTKTPDPTNAPTKAPTSAPTPTKEPAVTNTPTPAEGSSTPYVSPVDPVMHVGEKLQLTLVGAKAMDFFIIYDDLQEYLDVTSDGLVTAKKPISYISLMCLSEDGKMYTCGIKILSQDSGTGADENGIGSDGLGSKDHYDFNSMSSKVSLGNTYGLISSHTREPYQKTMEFTIEREDEFIRACRTALEHGVESFTIKYRSFDGEYWWNKFKNRIRCYSDLSGYTADGFTRMPYDETTHTLTIKPAYKDVWKAVTYIRYSGYEVDDDIKKLINAAMQMSEDAIAANPGDTKAVLLYVNNRICEMTTYTDPIPEESDCPQRDATGVFFYGDGVCESYTAAMRLVLNILGFENDTIVNEKGTHIWNRVKLDGTYYHIDVTWNDIEDQWRGGYLNTYFLLTESELIEKSTKGKKTDDPERLDHLWYNFYH
ncbi:MAG: Ig-like domain-containing protein [Lachnospiraceae bacterium]|nr:Ig-like domain-containing protein [Lachnospiraceae bacterium]